MSNSTGVLLSVRWGEQELAREFLPLGAPRAFTIGSDPGCDFACGGARSFELIDVEENGASVQQRDGSRSPLERGVPVTFEHGALTFEARLGARPPRVRTGPFAELATVNLSLMMLAAFGFFAVAAANRDAEGDDLADDLSSGSTRVVKALIQNNLARQASASAAAPRKTTEKFAPVASPSHKARTVAPSRPTGRPGKGVDVASIFRGPGAASVFGSSGLGDDLRAASTGLRTAEAGEGLGTLGGGHGLDGNGLGGLSPTGIGVLGTRGGRGPGNTYGIGGILTPKTTTEIPDPEPGVSGCTVDSKPCLDKELIRQVIRRNLASFRYCYESRLNRYPALEGKVSVRFSLVPSGKVALSQLAQSTANNAELEQCVVDRTRLLQFPSGKWNGMVVVTYPFIFKQSGK